MNNVIGYCPWDGKPLAPTGRRGRPRRFCDRVCWYQWRGRKAPRATRALTQCVSCPRRFRQKATRGMPATHCPDCRK